MEAIPNGRATGKNISAFGQEENTGVLRTSDAVHQAIDLIVQALIQPRGDAELIAQGQGAITCRLVLRGISGRFMESGV